MKRPSAHRVPWLPIAGAVAAVVGATVSVLGLSGPLAVVIAAAAAVPPAVKGFSEEMGKRREARRGDPDLGRLLRVSTLTGVPQVADVDPFQVGVAAVRAPVVRSSLAPRPYVPREADDELDAALRTAGLTVIVGPAASGKSRVAIEALKRVHADRRFLAPDAGGALRSVVAVLRSREELRPAVVWLDDLETYLVADGLTIDVLREIEQLYPPVGVVATMRFGEWDAVMTGGEVTRTVREVLRRARPVFIKPHLSAKELDEYGRLYAREDVDVVSGVERYGLGPYFVGAPDLIVRLKAGETAEHPGAAVVRAAADWSRTGMFGPIPEEVLRRLYPSYAPRDKRDAESLQEGLEWALQPLDVPVSLIEQVEHEETGRRSYGLPDFMVEVVESRHSTVAPAAWDAAIAGANGPEAVRIGWMALSQLGPAGAETSLEAFTLADRAGLSEGAVGMGFAELVRDDDRRAEAIWRAAADGGNLEACAALGGFLHARGDVTEAERYLRSAAGGGIQNGIRALGALEAERGNYEKAEALLVPLEEVDPGAAFFLALIGYERGQLVDAERRARAAAAAGHPGAPGLVGAILEEKGAAADAVPWYQRGADAGDPEAQIALASHLVDTDRAAARRWLRTAWEEEEHPEAAHLLGDLAAEDGKPKLAARFWREAADLGNVAASRHLGDYLAEQGRSEEAESLLRRAARLGDIDAALHLAGALHDVGKHKESEKWLRSAAKRGSASAACNLGGLLLERGDEKQAQEWLRRALEKGHVHAATRLGAYFLVNKRHADAEPILTEAANADDAEGAVLLGILLEETGRSRKAERWYRMAAQRGNEVAQGRLGQWLVAQRPLIGVPFRASAKEREGERLLREAADDGNTDAMVSLGNLADRRKRYDEARRWWLDAARQGDQSAAYNLGLHLYTHGRKDEGEHWLRQAADAHYGAAIRFLINVFDADGRSRLADRYRGNLHVATAEHRPQRSHLSAPYGVSFRSRGV